MQKLNSVNSHAELQQRLADHGGSGDTARENGTKHIPSPAEPVDTVQCSSRKMLVGLDILCLLVETTLPLSLSVFSPLAKVHYSSIRLALSYSTLIQCSLLEPANSLLYTGLQL
ncbi:phospholipid phosphatase 3-like protein [Labeo rohita]|uniref:Phospholipid phosphatase 3-like protein n=1 Tax=Labeo rohita TaxID=84645 RepID=A0A498L6P5_LABRO|nr:phospholipid phosphatase 3-like protein [Labeo rohita]